MAGNMDEGSGIGPTGGAPDFEHDGPNDQYQDLRQIATERLSSLVNALVEAIKAQPTTAAAATAAAVGTLIGLRMAGRSRSRTDLLGKALTEQAEAAEKQAGQAKKAGKRLGRVTDLSELVPIALKLLENPLVRAFLVRALAKRFARRFK